MIYQKKINVCTDQNDYPIFIGKNILKSFNKHYVSSCPRSKKILFVTNSKIPNKYLLCVKSKITKKSKTYTVNIPAGEKNKNFKEVNKILNFLTINNFNRNDTVVALGGSVVGDVAGFVASIFKRGINFVQIPSTLLAQVDSSVGGKTGINSNHGKNLIGTFYHPKFVIIDIDVLSSLPKREMLSGFAEILKYSLIMNRKFFFWLCNESTNIISREKSSSILKAISISCKCKSIVVNKDEKEKGIRAILNFGHTLGHALESHLKYSSQLNHGEAVIIGMMAAAKVSQQKGFLSEKDLEQINNLYRKLKLNDSIAKYIKPKQIVKFSQIMKKDKKNNSDSINLILLKKIGKAFIYKTTLNKTFIPFVKNELKNG